MYLCYCKPQLLNHVWAVELVQQPGEKVNYDGETALILLFIIKPDKTDFNSDGFKLLWEKEKDIEVDRLKEWMQEKP